VNDEIKVNPAEQKRPSLMVATPMYGGMCTGTYVQGLLLTMQKMREVGVHATWCQIMNESLITRARNELVRVFLERGYDYLMFIDADIGFDGEAVAQLMLADKDVVCGLYPRKDINWDDVKVAATSGKANLADYAATFVLNLEGEGHTDIDSDGCMEIRYGGTGFMLIKRGVFEHLMPHVPTYHTPSRGFEDSTSTDAFTHEFFATSIHENGSLLSEDYHFCDLFRKHGGKIHAHPFVKLTHTGTYIFRGDVLKSGTLHL
jgi:hypothetical protein